ncbi:hypothetical protein V7122_22605, partial [Bacillus sp. JJ1532]|uniref:hypothetical protein n=1 Tax=Bacillus sp. JJ1532 TaxID=3122958 RepID=UPI002FFD7B4D
YKACIVASIFGYSILKIPYNLNNNSERGYFCGFVTCYHIHYFYYARVFCLFSHRRLMPKQKGREYVKIFPSLVHQAFFNTPK